MILKALNLVRWHYTKMILNISISIRLVYGGFGLKSDYFKTFLSKIQNVLKINNLPHCVHLISNKLKVEAIKIEAYLSRGRN